MVHPAPADLSGVALFAGVPADELARLAEQFDVEEFLAGHSLARVGDHGYTFFVLAEGTARVEVDGETVEHLGPGSAFGEMAFFASNSRRTATVVAETPVRVLTLFGVDFRTMQAHYPQVAERIERLHTERSARDSAHTGEAL